MGSREKCTQVTQPRFCHSHHSPGTIHFAHSCKLVDNTSGRPWDWIILTSLRLPDHLPRVPSYTSLSEGILGQSPPRGPGPHIVHACMVLMATPISWPLSRGSTTVCVRATGGAFGSDGVNADLAQWTSLRVGRRVENGTLAPAPCCGVTGCFADFSCSGLTGVARQFAGGLGITVLDTRIRSWDRTIKQQIKQTSEQQARLIIKTKFDLL